MLYQFDYVTQKIKEDEIAERLRQAETDRLVLSLKPAPSSILNSIQQHARTARRSLAQFRKQIVQSGSFQTTKSMTP
ncbi:MAG: hypothetical protein HZB51_03835 [Chloroflexi bacterium]|nr:hypothetical protein [Chloroflexota bacterium]